jgi:ABC-type antimicrobial peptide transport system permease subunit
MSIQAIFLILIRHIRSKFGRILLAQAGIMIGVWAITLTTSLSLGLSDNIVKAINSQPNTKEINIYKVQDEKTNFFELQSAPKFVLIGSNDIEKIKKNVPEITEIAPFANAISFIKNPSTTGIPASCVTEGSKIARLAVTANQQQIAPLPGDGELTQPQPNPPTKQEVVQKKALFDSQCLTFSTITNSFQSYLNNNEKKMVGDKRKPGRNEISLCYKCGDLELGKKLGANSPQEMLGKTITLEFKQAIEFNKAGNVFDVLESNTLNTKRDFSEGKPNEYKIISVIDDQKSDVNVLGGGGTTTSYIDYSHFLDEIKRVDPLIADDQIGFLNVNAVISDYTNLDKALEGIKKEKYISFSPSQFLVSGVKTLFSVFTYFLAGFGFIVLIASVFGIVNVMTISVLERRKEIGIIKSMGANNTHIFWLFLLESGFLGLLGWIFGTLLAVLSGYGISKVFITLINSNSSWRDNLEQFNIKEFSPSFPPVLVLSTLGLALFFTILSGLLPAIRASRQHIVEVLRSE